MTTHPKEDVYRQLLFGGRIPLPDEKFPRTFEERKPTGGYYIAFGLILAVWMITPLSW